MFKALFAMLFGGWPSDLPRLYPDLDETQLALFLSDEDYQRIKAFDTFYILPFVAEGKDETQTCFGLGLAKLMIRNLMLLNDVSIHGPEDTPAIFHEMAADHAAQNPRASYVSGLASFDDRGFHLSVDVFRRGKAKVSRSVSELDFGAFLKTCTTTIGEAIGSQLELTVEGGWTVGQPADPESLIRCGELQFHYDREDSAGKAPAAERALAADPTFVVPAWEIDGDLPRARKSYLEGLRRDPFNAQLCFLTFCNVWKSQHPQPEAVQFCRRAIELSPGHGKAHMCVPHSAPRNISMICHSELGYRLLPGNSFAVNNYTVYLNDHGAPADKLIELGEEGIAMDPCDPGSYMRLIELHLNLGNTRAALRIAERLQKLYEPRYNERALYCLRQNPEVARLIDSGEYDPAAENRKLIADLRREARREK